MATVVFDDTGDSDVTVNSDVDFNNDSGLYSGFENGSGFDFGFDGGSGFDFGFDGGFVLITDGDFSDPFVVGVVPCNEVLGTVGDDIIIVNDDTLPDYVDPNGNSPSDQDDCIQGLEGDDIIYAYLGKDKVNGNQGNDAIYGGANDDTLGGGKGNDFVYGEDGNDILKGGLNEDNDLFLVDNKPLGDTLDGGAGRLRPI